MSTVEEEKRRGRGRTGEGMGRTTFDDEDDDEEEEDDDEEDDETELVRLKMGILSTSRRVRGELKEAAGEG